MYMSGVSTSPEGEVLRDLEGARILMTGLSASGGVDIARTFADLKGRLVLHATDLSPELTEVVAVLSQSAAEMKLFTDDIGSADGAVGLARKAAQAFGGLDAVINLVTISAADMAGIHTEQQVEDLVSVKLSPIAHLTRVTANRMRVVMSEGLILNVLMMPNVHTGREAAIATLARATLQIMTNAEAHAWADQGIRINAIGPRITSNGLTPSGAYVTNEPDLAALALYLASKRGKSLSGHVFDAEGVANV